MNGFLVAITAIQALTLGLVIVVVACACRFVFQQETHQQYLRGVLDANRERLVESIKAGEEQLREGTSLTKLSDFTFKEEE